MAEFYDVKRLNLLRKMTLYIERLFTSLEFRGLWRMTKFLCITRARHFTHYTAVHTSELTVENPYEPIFILDYVKMAKLYHVKKLNLLYHNKSR